jgi:hypothetical protein
VKLRNVQIIIGKCNGTIIAIWLTSFLKAFLHITEVGRVKKIPNSENESLLNSSQNIAISASSLRGEAICLCRGPGGIYVGYADGLLRLEVDPR